MGGSIKKAAKAARDYMGIPEKEKSSDISGKDKQSLNNIQDQIKALKNEVKDLKEALKNEVKDLKDSFNRFLDSQKKPKPDPSEALKNSADALLEKINKPKNKDTMVLIKYNENESIESGTLFAKDFEHEYTKDFLKDTKPDVLVKRLLEDYTKTVASSMSNKTKKDELENQLIEEQIETEKLKKRDSQSIFNELFKNIIDNEKINKIYNNQLEDAKKDSNNLFQAFMLISTSKEYASASHKTDANFNIIEREKDLAQLITFYLLGSFRSKAINYAELNVIIEYCNANFKDYKILLPGESDTDSFNQIKSRNVFENELTSDEISSYSTGTPIKIENYKFLPIEHKTTPDFSKGLCVFGYIDIALKMKENS